jgi:alcohol dehydrogenase class IV
LVVRFEFATAGRIVFGAGAVADLGKLAQEFGRRALLVTGASPARSTRVQQLLSASNITSTPFQVAGEPKISTVQDGVHRAQQERCEFVISVGGGSVIDAGKAIAAMIKNPGEVLDYLEVVGAGKPLACPSAAFIAVPTTAGTGSEVTRNAVLGSPGHGVKASLRSPWMLPRIALVDPELTYDLPSALTASTGLDALTQLLEPYVCLRSNPITDAFCCEGIPRVARSLRTAFQQPHSVGARADMAFASLLGGLALANAGLGAVHGFAAPIGGHFPAPHGAVCAALLPHAWEVNLQVLRSREPRNAVLPRYEQIAQWLTGNPAAKAEDAAPWLRSLIADLRIPGLAEYGLRPEHTDNLVQKASQASSMKANPVKLSAEELQRIILGAL